MKDFYVIKYGETGTKFFIMLEGSVSVWIPFPATAILNPLHRLRQRVKKAIISDHAKIKDFNFCFYLDPLVVEDERRATYCNFVDFQDHCCADQSEEFAKYLWT